MYNQNIQDLGKDKYGRTVQLYTCPNGRKHYYLDGKIQDEPAAVYDVFPPKWKMQRIYREGEPLPETVWVNEETGDEWQYTPEF